MLAGEGRSTGFSADGVSPENPLSCFIVQERGSKTMAKAYWVGCYRSISNPDALAAYAKLAGPSITAAGGKFLVRGTPAKTYEAGLDQRTVVIEFESVAAAIAAHDSPGYQEALRALGKGAERDIRILEGA